MSECNAINGQEKGGEIEEKNKQIQTGKAPAPAHATIHSSMSARVIKCSSKIMINNSVVPQAV